MRSIGTMIAVMLLSACTHAANAQPSIESQCDSAEDHGWPRFHSREELQADKKWSMYLTQVYGDLPNNYPICLFDFWKINVASYFAAGLNGSRPILNPYAGDVLKSGDLFFGGVSGLNIYHENWTAVPNNTWVEVAHAVVPTEISGSWAWRARGSGVFYNVGRTIVFPTPADMKLVHREAIEFLTNGCSRRPSSHWPQLESDVFGFCAREKGYDSVQFAPNRSAHALGTFGLIGATELVMVNLDGDRSCGVPNATQTPLRIGWQASVACECEANAPIPPACGIMPECPVTWWRGGCHPKICQTPPCSMTTCQQLAPVTCRTKKALLPKRIPRDAVVLGEQQQHAAEDEIERWSMVSEAAAIAAAARAEAAAAGAAAWVADEVQ